MVTARKTWFTSLAAMLCWCAAAWAQQLVAATQSGQGTQASATGTVVVPDAQVEANVLKALAASPDLAAQNISTTAVYGVVTMTGTVKEDALRRKAETIVSTTAGVKRVVDRLAIGAAAAPSGGAQGGGDTAALQHGAEDGQAGSDAAQQGPGGQGVPPGEPGQPGGQGQAGPPASGNNQQAQNPDGGWTGDYPLPSDRPPSPLPPTPEPRYRRPYSAPPPAPEYGGGQEEQQRGQQQAGVPVVVPAGSVLRVRIDDGLDSQQAQVGNTFNGIVLRNIMAGGNIAIPRGTAAMGTIVEVQGRGRPVLALQITQLMLDGVAYPVVTDAWSRPGMSRAPQAVNNGFGVIGAQIGGVSGGGGGALLGVGLVGATGVATTMAVGGRGSVVIPAEAILSFHLMQPVNVTTVSQAEIDSLAAGVPQVVYRSGCRGVKSSTIAWGADHENEQAGDLAVPYRYQE